MREYPCENAAGSNFSFYQLELENQEFLWESNYKESFYQIEKRSIKLEYSMCIDVSHAYLSLLDSQ